MKDKKEDQKHKENQEYREDKKVGVYICYCGGNISDHVDVERVREYVENLPEVAVARTNMFMCSDPGQQLIMDDLKNGTVERVVVASCAPSLHETTFRSAISRAGINPYIYEHANIREQVSWVHHGDQATEKAIKLISMASAKAEQLSPLEPIRVNAKKHATVIGGGVAGLRAAKDMADCGIEVALIEKSQFLGGNLAPLDKIAPTGESAKELLSTLALQVLCHPSITIYAGSVVDSFEGYVGNFTLGVKQVEPLPSKAADSDITAEADISDIQKTNETDKYKKGDYIPFSGVFAVDDADFSNRSDSQNLSVSSNWKSHVIETGVIVIATGFKSYTPNIGEYGYKKIKEVITLPELIKSMADSLNSGRLSSQDSFTMQKGSACSGKVRGLEKFLEIDGRKIRSMAMIHCVGSRQTPGIHQENDSGQLNEYCSRTCCTATLNAANIIRERYPSTRIYDFFRDIRTYGRGQEEIYEKASHNQVIFFRFEADEPPEIIESRESQSGKNFESNSQLNNFPICVKAKDVLTFGEEIEAPVDLVVLATGIEPNDVSDLVQKMKLPVGADRFLLEVHPKLRPVELPVSGIFLAGTCQAPMDIGESCNAAGAAAVKAAAMLAKGYVELDPFVAQINLELCNGCGACVESCLSDGALRIVDIKADGELIKRAEVTPPLCLGCGACVGVCSENAIDIAGWTLRQYEAMVDRIVAENILAVIN
ncbi:MAG: CoB--CoM heterodisulfide reductase iron-sulfur subunit A family protein [Desulfamplus sp.]|nr:CoB--CoM heterodisulfide reductase iron-sulfur subunit A family protein [Desulfamplus sp.]